MNDPDHPFERLTQNRVPVTAAFFDKQHEQRVLKQLTAGLRLHHGHTMSRLREWDLNDGGDGTPTLRGFSEEHPTFPALLGASRLSGAKLHLDPTAILPAIFNHFDRTPFARAYADFYEANIDRANGRVLGLVFSRNGISQGLIIHNAGIDYRSFRGTYFGYVGSTKNGELYVRSYQAFLAAIYREGWRPEA